VSAIRGRIEFDGHLWELWSEAPGVGARWAYQIDSAGERVLDDNGKTNFIKVRKVTIKGESSWRIVEEEEQKS